MTHRLRRFAAATLMTALLSLTACETENHSMGPEFDQGSEAQVMTKDFRGRIKRIRIRERNSGTDYRLAADFRGRIKRVRIRERASGTDYRVAADFRGRIKRVRIRERANGADYNLQVDVDTDNVNEAADQLLVTLSNGTSKEQFKLTPPKGQVGTWTFDDSHSQDQSLLNENTEISVQPVNFEGKAVGEVQIFSIAEALKESQISEPVKEVEEIKTTKSAI